MSDRRPRSIAARIAIAPLALLALGPGAAPPEDDAGPAAASESRPERRWREPVALAPSPDGSWLYVANRESGTVSVIDVDRSRLAGEVAVGASVVDLNPLPDGRHLLAIDERSSRVELLAADGEAVAVVAGVAVASGPVSASVDPCGDRAFVASTWPRQVSVLGLERPEDGGTGVELLGEIPLPFEPGRVLALGEGKAAVADAFGGILAVVDGRSLEVESVRELPAHNIRGLALDAAGEHLLVAHQMLNRGGRTDQNDIHWAAFITSNLRALPLSAVLDPAADLVAEGRLYHLSDVGAGGADPNGVLALPDGTVAVALGGVDEVVFGPASASIGHRVAVGRRPVALARAPGSNRVFSADAFGDTVSVVPLEDGAHAASIPLGPHPEPDEIRLGRELFHDARLAHDGWMSCHSCHTDGHTNGRLVDTLGDDSYGTPKRTPSLLGAAGTGPWTWDGSMDSIGDQVDKSVVATMRGYPLGQDQTRAIEAYVRSLPSAPPLADGGAATDAVARGSAAFARLRCDRCHAPPTYTTPEVYDVGLADERGGTEFNPPSLLGVSRRPGLFHDGRAGTLEQVFEEFGHQIDEPLPEEELAELLAFLRSL